MTREVATKDKCYRKIITLIIITIIIIIACNMFLELKKVDGESMFPTIASNDVVLVNKVYKEIRFNDIIIFYYSSMQLIKRVIAFEGDIVEIKKGQLLVNDNIMANFDDISFECSRIVIAKDEYFVIGDNYKESYDSRHFGPIQKKEVIGVVVKIL